MKFLAQTLWNYMIGISRPILLEQNDIHELRIFLASFSPDTIYEVGIQYRDYLASQSQLINLVFKIGKPLWEEWHTSQQAGDMQSVLQAVKQEGWIDQEDRLTHYRNLKWTPDSGEDVLIVVLIGVEQAIDHGSLQDFYLVDAATLWNTALKRSFKTWLQAMLAQKQIDIEDEQLQHMDALLKKLYQYGLGDLERMANFLETLALEGAQDGLDALNAMYEALPFWDLPVIMDIPVRKQWHRYMDAAVSFFSYQPYLKEYERKKTLKKITQFRDRYQNEQINAELPAEFSDLDDFADTLRSYVEKNAPEARQRLLRVNFVFIKDHLLDFRERKPTAKKPTLRKIDAPPLEAVLTGLWLTLIEFKKRCDAKGVQPAKALRHIRLKARKFRHDFEDEEQARELLIGCLGGIDQFIEHFLTFDTQVEGEPKSIPVECRLASGLTGSEEPGQLILESARSSIPGFQFVIEFEADDNLGTEREFQWQLPATHPYRNLWNLSRLVYDELKNLPGYVLPCFHLPFYRELFFAPDEEEANRILMLGLKRLTVRNLLDASDVKTSDPLWPYIKDISSAFGDFLQSLVHKGYFATIEGSVLNEVEEPVLSGVEGAWRHLFEKIRVAFETLVSDERISRETHLAPLLYKAFMILDEPTGSQPFSWWHTFVGSAVITGLHPALLEMLRHREAFLLHGMTEKLKDALQDATGKRITEQHWQEVCDLATIHYPIVGMICNSQKELDTRVASFGLIHRVGEASGSDEAALSAKVLLRYDAPEDESIADADLFRQTRESRVITRILHEFTRLHLYAQDGLTIAVLNAVNIQAVISGIDAFLKSRLAQRDGQTSLPFPPYHFTLNLFMRTSDSQVVSHWMQEWRKRWEPAQALDKFDYYQRCKLSRSVWSAAGKII